MSLRSCLVVMRCMFVLQCTVGLATGCPRTVVGGGAGAAPVCVGIILLLQSTHPKVGMALLIRVGVKAQVWALARHDAHYFLAVWAVSCIVVLRCGDCFFVLSRAARDVVAASISCVSSGLLI